MLDRTRPGPNRYLRAGRRSSGRLQRLSSSGSAAGDVEPNYTSVEMPRVRPPLSSRSASGEQICTLDNISILRPKIWAQFGHNLGTIWGAVMTNLERNLGAIWAPGAHKLGIEPRKRATQFGQAGRARRPRAKRREREAEAKQEDRERQGKKKQSSLKAYLTREENPD